MMHTNLDWALVVFDVYFSSSLRKHMKKIEFKNIEICEKNMQIACNIPS